ncbi:MAG: TIGR00730 family Rossman fold protein [Micavibrio sp.]|nr:TIGR00730 family Rossman fold protein [Micavibrio sp.]|tara:strand:+ start:2780 stop:3673 length:894 start_codon:yes stop_codon:yes gene_type:complete
MNDLNMLTVYLGSSGHCRDIFKDTARQFGALIAEKGKSLVYGGMDTGLMGILAKTAHENGADVTGIIPLKLKDSERILKGITKTILVEELCDRKKQMFKMADAVVTLPGGFGTADEALELLYWGSRKLHQKPVVFVNIDGYWDEFIDFINSTADFNPAYLIIVNSIDEVFPALENWQAPEIVPSDALARFPHFEDEICRNTSMPIIIDEATIENTYYAICALGLRQLGKHERSIGFLNKNKQFDKLESWIRHAAKERFITEKCLQLFAIEEDEDTLMRKSRAPVRIEIDLHNDKWGD